MSFTQSKFKYNKKNRTIRHSRSTIKLSPAKLCIQQPTNAHEQLQLRLIFKPPVRSTPIPAVDGSLPGPVTVFTLNLAAVRVATFLRITDAELVVHAAADRPTNNARLASNHRLPFFIVQSIWSRDWSARASC